MPSARDLLLALFAASEPDEWLDPIRVMKGLFLAQMETGSDPNDRVPMTSPPFRFEPYSYGPFSQGVYRELESLREDGLLQSSPIMGKDYLVWSLTDQGKAAAQLAMAQLGPDGEARVRHARSVVRQHSFDGLLRYVYSRYPDHATRSVVNRP